MTDETINLTTFTRTEAHVLQSFIGQVDYWLSTYGEKANTVEIVYYPEDDGFEVVNNEENNGLLKRNRVTSFRAELLSWAANQLKNLKGWNNENEVKTFALKFENEQFGVSVEILSKNELQQ